MILFKLSSRSASSSSISHTVMKCDEYRGPAVDHPRRILSNSYIIHDLPRNPESFNWIAPGATQPISPNWSAPSGANLLPLRASLLQWQPIRQPDLMVFWSAPAAKGQEIPKLQRRNQTWNRCHFDHVSWILTWEMKLVCNDCTDFKSVQLHLDMVRFTAYPTLRILAYTCTPGGWKSCMGVPKSKFLARGCWDSDHHPPIGIKTWGPPKSPDQTYLNSPPQAHAQLSFGRRSWPNSWWRSLWARLQKLNHAASRPQWACVWKLLLTRLELFSPMGLKKCSSRGSPFPLNGIGIAHQWLQTSTWSI